MMDVLIKNNRPEIVQSTIISYVSKLKNISNGIGKKIDSSKDIVKNVDAIIDYLESNTINNARARSAAVLALLDKKDKTKQEILVYDKFKKKILEFKKRQDQEIDKKKNGESDSEISDEKEDEDKILNWNTILNKYEKLEQEVKTFNIDNLTKEEYSKIQLYVILSCYVLIPVRRSKDFLVFKIRNENTEKDNYLRKDKLKYFFVFNNHKTGKKYTGSDAEVEIPKKLFTIIEMWKMINNGDYLIMNKHREKPLTAGQLNILLTNFFGSNIGTNKLRHLYISSLFTEEDREKYKAMKKLAKQMGHSVNTQQQFYVD